MIGYKHAQTFQAYFDSGTKAIAKLGSPSNSGTQAPTPFPTTAAPTPPTAQPTKSPTAAPTSYPTISCSSFDGRKGRCKNAENCLWDSSTRKCYDLSGDLPCSLLSLDLCETTDGCAWALIPEESKSAACYEVDDVPDPVDDMKTPSSCGNVNYEDAQALCEDMGLDLCLGSELVYADIKNTCNYDNKWVWSSTECGNGKYYQVHKNKMKVRCKKSSGKGGTRCC
ncbi:Hypothetical Protein FCC1311_114222 [Hondaea fermentalgiana]|uniref:Uncharacterized protein n=1 Tax=Hondaea fermentalgiana TaxID=2315210 RepID=A0A2R5GY00_9STRA|nr:Hypothetical Protein FCC1311_114222 [Hondaea fermentalgiana]|eukprot:GBG35199.1 Hypothetical Protein FCC1311_114222 [Hondaea fermentalgiana]